MNNRNVLANVNWALELLREARRDLGLNHVDEADVRLSRAIRSLEQARKELGNV